MRSNNLSVNEAIRRGLRPAVILIPVIVFVTLIAIGTVNGEMFIAALNSFFVGLMVNGSWLVALGTLAFVIFMLVKGVNKLTKKKEEKKQEEAPSKSAEEELLEKIVVELKKKNK